MSVVETKTIPNPKKINRKFENYDEYIKAIQETYKKYKNINKNSFSSWGRNDSSSNNDRKTLSSDYKKKDIIQWFKNPDQYEKELRELSSYLYISKGIYYNIINFYTNLLTLDYSVIPNFIPDINDLDKITKEKNKVDKYCDDILEKPNLRKIIKAVLKDNTFYGYERKNQNTYYIQKLNPNYCRQGVIKDGQPTIEFDFSYFNNDKKKLKLYDKEFTKKYNQYKKNNNKWQELNYQKTICIPLESEDYNFPSLTGIFDDLIDIDDFYKYLKDSTELDTNKLLAMKVPTNDEAEILVPPDIIEAFLSDIAEVLPNKVKIIAMPFDLHSETLTQSKMQQNNGIKEMEDSIARNSGISKDILSNSSGASGLKINLEINIAYVFAIVEKIQVWLKKRLRRLTIKKYPFKVEFLRTTTINRQDEFDMAYKMLSIGGSLTDVISARGMNPKNYFNLLRMENLNKVKDLLKIPQSIYTSSNKNDTTNEGGAPKKDDTKLTDTGEKTRDQDKNDR